MANKTKKTPPTDLEPAEELIAQLQTAAEKEKRALADYQNLVRRTQEDRAKLIKLANQELITALLQPLEHLELAVRQQADQGVEMVLEQLKRTLAEFGLAEIEVEGKDFDVNTMEAAEGSQEGGKVKQVLRKGYTLNGTVIQHSKVILE